MRNQGAQYLDPARFHYLEVLSQRLDTAPAEVRRILEGKFKVALADYEQRFRQAKKAASDELASLSAQHPELARELQRLFVAGDFRAMRRLGGSSAINRPCAPLAQLNQHIRDVKKDSVDHHPGSDLGSSLVSDMAANSEMASVRRFRETWSKIAAEGQVAQSVDRGPVNAGPLNSHMLVLRSLALMRKLSPDYLRRFLSHVDTLLWLDQANQQDIPLKAKPVRRSRTKK
ncbi:DUF2894 domain-containing protein [Polaromonas sp. UC242_47]|uniref:DUF2894 domain-containing protein n=1 Tax=Polaromonas sp. UC242_47 TaxID=3374626 RepID=UPI0037B5DA0F